MSEYSCILDRNIKETFLNYVRNLKIDSVDYFAIGVQNKIKKVSTSLMSCCEWQKEFAANQYAQFDPLRNSVLSSNEKTIFLQDLPSSSSIAKEIMQKRKKFGISKGIVIIERHTTHNFMLTVGTNYSKFDEKIFWYKNQDKLYTLLHHMKEIIRPIAQFYT